MARAKRSLFSDAGNVAMIFALAAVPITVTVGAAVEWTRITNAKAKLDRATDAAVLAAKKIQIENKSLGLTAARQLAEDGAQKTFVQNTIELNQVAQNATLAITWDADGSARGIGKSDAILMFGGLLGMGTAPIESLAVVASGADGFIEIAMVLDNTGSMFETDGRPKTRFTLMREAATRFVNLAFDDMTEPSLLRFSIVPYATAVNVKSEAPLDWDASAGPLGTMPDYGSRITVATPMDRSSNIAEDASTLTSMFAPVGWRGCIKGDGESMVANDDAKPGMSWNALSIPANPIRSNWKPLVDGPGVCQNCTGTPDLDPNAGGGGTPPVPPTTPPAPTPPTPKGKGKGKNAEYRPAQGRPNYASLTPPRSATEARFLTFGQQTQKSAVTCVDYACTVKICDASATWKPNIACNQNTMKNYGPDATDTGRRNSFMKANTTCSTNPDYTCSDSEALTGTLAPCVADPNEIGWNNGGGAWCSWVPTTTWTQFDDSIGPNVNCPMPMLGLSGSRPQILATINRMSPVVGGTHSDVGLRWGLRTLSSRPQWASFFGTTGPKAPLPFRSGNSKKAMVLITDGQNTEAEDFPGNWGCSDTSAPGCTGAPTPADLDTRMLDWCRAIREDYGVTLYTVAVNISDATAVNKLVTCAGSPDRSFAVDAADLGRTLASIQASIFQLRLTE